MAPIGKHRPTRRIDHQPDSPFGSSVGTGEGTGFTAPPAPPTIPAPTGLTLSSALSYSAVTPSARITASWAGLETYDLEYYVLQISTDSTFATNTETYSTAPNQNSAVIDNRRVSTTYYARVRTVVGDTPSDWSATANTTTPNDTTVPAVPTSQAAAFINGGDLLVTWVNPTSSNFRDVEVSVYASNGGALLARAYSGTQRYIFTVAQNLQATSNVGDPSLYVTLRSRSWHEVYSTLVSATATKAAPSVPTVTLTGGFSLLVCQVTSAPESVHSTFEYVWKRDGGTVRTLESPATEQQYEASASGDEGSHSWTCAVRQKDAFGQYSTATTSSAAVLYTLTIGRLRGDVNYRDSISSTFTPPNAGALAAMKDGTVGSGGITYSA
jgi:hypothetical protein